MEDLDRKKKKRYLASALLDSSFTIKSVYEMWYRLHSPQTYDLIAKHLQPNTEEPQMIYNTNKSQAALGTKSRDLNMQGSSKKLIYSE